MVGFVTKKYVTEMYPDILHQCEVKLKYLWLKFSLNKMFHDQNVLQPKSSVTKMFWDRDVLIKMSSAEMFLTEMWISWKFYSYAYLARGQKIEITFSQIHQARWVSSILSKEFWCPVFPFSDWQGTFCPSTFCITVKSNLKKILLMFFACSLHLTTFCC